MINKLFFSLFAAISLFGEESILVKLPTETPFSKVYLGHVNPKKAKFPAAYCTQLEEILRADLEMSGRFVRAENSKSLDKLLLTDDPKECFGSDQWSRSNTPHILKPQIVEDQFSAYLFTTKTGSLLRIQPLPLTGNLSEDRQVIHKLSDGIHKLLFSKEGVAKSHILYAAQEGKKSEIWVCDWDGGNAKQLTSDNYFAITPVFFPAKHGFTVDKFLYVSYRDGVPKIYLARLQSPSGSPFVTLRGNQLLPTICKDRSKIAFISDASGRADLFMQKIDVERGLTSKPIQAYSFPSSVQASPTFSPDGKKIAFVSDKEGAPHIYLIDTPLSMRGNKLPTAICLTTKNRENTCPNWSPDGRKIAYSAKTNGIRQIWVYDFDTSEEVQLTEGPGHKENPSWAPNSLHLVYDCSDGDHSELYVVDLNQKKPKQITSGVGRKCYPSWEP